MTNFIGIALGFVVFVIVIAVAGNYFYHPGTAATTQQQKQQDPSPPGNCHAERLRLLDKAMLASDQGNNVLADELQVQADQIPCPGTNPP